MDTAKPSSPSGEVGEADDLIEEMARMMAAGAKEKSVGAASLNNGGAQRTPANAAGAGQATEVPTPVRSPVQPAPAAAQSPAPSFSPAQQAFGGAPNTTPHAPGGAVQRAPSSPVPFAGAAPQGSAGTGGDAGGAKSAFKFELGGAGQSSKPASAPAPNPAPGGEMVPETPAQAPEMPPGQAAPASAPPAFGAAAQAEPLNDPIADLIRAQSQPAPQKVSAPEPPARTAQTGSLQAEAEARDAGDDFRVPPVFGMGGKPTEPAPSFPAPAPASQGGAHKPDALDEIESLIGNAVHVDFPQDSSAQNAVENPSRAPAPPVSQNVSAQPQAASIASPGTQSAPPGNNVDTAEAAILQAMSAASPGVASLPDDATGPEAVSAPAHAKPEESLLGGAAYEPRKPSAIKRYLVPATAALVLVSGAIAGYFMLNSGGTDAEAPFLLAEGSPTKETPSTPQTEGDGLSAVFSGIDGNSVPESEQRLVSRDQTEGATGNEVRQVITSNNTEAGLANRRVRTVTVRPDGTIISGDDAVAGSEVLPVAQPNLPELPAGAVNTELAGTTVAALPSSPDLTGGATTLASGGDGSAAPIPEARLTDLERQSRLGVTSVPRSNTQSSSGPGTVDLIASLASEAVAPPPANIPATTQPVAPQQTLQPVVNATNFVQMASLRDQGVAEETAANMQSRYASALRGGRLEVRRVDLGDRGVFYRVLLPTATLAEASSVCDAIQDAGGDCFPRNN
ncbi:MAG TPA: hypothetical protein ENJ90_05390 [Devosia sp.]|nr:hypothetical protein [Devosia sp.]